MLAKSFDLTGKVALVTGGSKGLRKAMARGFAKAGADVFLVSRNPKPWTTTRTLRWCQPSRPCTNLRNALD
jgi:NAD(P)-dependent dehydrogenase (short-subunit alcohol dehydrogenase family)